MTDLVERMKALPDLTNEKAWEVVYEGAREIERLTSKLAGYEAAFPPVSGGYQTVPVEPTQEMLLHGCKAGLDTGVLLDDTRFSCEMAVWKAMLANAPKL